jgi:hypothetical protein
MFLIFCKGWGLNYHQVPIVPIKFSKSSIKFLLFLSITHQNLFVLMKFPNSSHQVHLVLINNSSKSFCSYQVPINISFHFHQLLIVHINFPSTSHSSHQLLFVPNPTLHKPTRSSKLWHQILFLQLGNLVFEIVPCKKDKKNV